MYSMPLVLSMYRVYGHLTRPQMLRVHRSFAKCEFEYTSYLIHMNTRFVTKTTNAKTTNANERQAPTNHQQSLRNECSQSSGLKSENNRAKKYFFPRCRLRRADTGRWVYTSSRRTWSCHIVTFGFSAKGTSDFPQVTWERDKKRRAEACSADNAGMRTTFFNSN